MTMDAKLVAKKYNDFTFFTETLPLNNGEVAMFMYLIWKNSSNFMDEISKTLEMDLQDLEEYLLYSAESSGLLEELVKQIKDSDDSDDDV
jgi:hypothetical protein